MKEFEKPVICHWFFAFKRMHFFPRSVAEWVRSIAYPVFCFCCLLLAYSFGEGFDHDRLWRYAGPQIAGELLPTLGIVLSAMCLIRTGLSSTFRAVAWTIALLSIVFGPFFMATLAE